MMAKTLIHEPFTGPFTGHLSTYSSSTTGLRYSFKPPCPRVERDRAYMVEVNTVTNQLRLILVTGIHPAGPR